MRKEQLKEIIKLHQKWLNGEEGGVKANLEEANFRLANLEEANLEEANFRWVNLEGANFRGTNLRWANLEEANFRWANLEEANLEEANFRWANLQEANFRGANLRWANFRGANLREANLRGVKLQGANLQSASLRGVNLQGANLPSFQIAPPSGDFICWKKGQNGDIIKLKCPWFARRCSSLIGRKIRLELATVIKIEDKNGKEKQQSTGLTYPGLIYKVGEFVKPDSYDPDIRVECANGIHAFIAREEAEEW